jgi:hypothetical protein
VCHRREGQHPHHHNYLQISTDNIALKSIMPFSEELYEKINKINSKENKWDCLCAFVCIMYLSQLISYKHTNCLQFIFSYCVAWKREHCNIPIEVYSCLTTTLVTQSLPDPPTFPSNCNLRQSIGFSLQIGPVPCHHVLQFLKHHSVDCLSQTAKPSQREEKRLSSGRAGGSVMCQRKKHKNIYN